jgi:hypothetical protein
VASHQHQHAGEDTRLSCNDGCTNDGDGLSWPCAGRALLHHNDVASFTDAKDSGILGVIHKATEGGGFVDSMYERHQLLASQVGLLWGAYQFGFHGDQTGQQTVSSM